MPGETVLPLPAAVPPLTAVRSTLLVSSLDNLRAAGLFERYRAHLDEHSASELLFAVPGSWLDVSVAVAHYEAWESLGLSPREHAEFGGQLFRRVRGTLLGTALRLSTNVGVTPWALLSQAGRFWDRAFRGSALGVVRLGPRDARVELAGMPLVNIPCFRNALRGVISSFVELVAERCVLSELADGASPTSRTFHVQWL